MADAQRLTLATPEVRQSEGVKMRATRQGYYGHKIRPEGAIFVVKRTDLSFDTHGLLLRNSEREVKAMTWAEPADPESQTTPVAIPERAGRTPSPGSPARAGDPGSEEVAFDGGDLTGDEPEQPVEFVPGTDDDDTPL